MLIQSIRQYRVYAILTTGKVQIYVILGFFIDNLDMCFLKS